MSSRFAVRLLGVPVLLAVLAGCPEANELIELTVNGVTIDVEVADDPDEREQGLMHRPELPEDRGMLFVFPDENLRSFWMKNTMIPLSIAYITSQGTIVEIHDMEPQSLKPVRSVHPVQYALEVNKGFFERNNVVVGDRVDLRNLNDR